MLVVMLVDVIGERIRTLRKQRGWSQEKLGEMTDMTQKQISKIEIDGTHDVRKLKRLADVFGMTVDDLLDDSKLGMQELLMTTGCYEE